MTQILGLNLLGKLNTLSLVLTVTFKHKIGPVSLSLHITQRDTDKKMSLKGVDFYPSINFSHIFIQISQWDRCPVIIP